MQTLQRHAVRLMQPALLALLLNSPLAHGAADATGCDTSLPEKVALGPVTLAEAAKAQRLLIGSAANAFVPWADSAQYRAILGREFSLLVPENEMKWKLIHPERARYDFSYGDCLVRFAQQRGMVVQGGPLVWHRQLSPWLEQTKLDRAAYVALLREHIHTVVGHYREQFPGVVVQWEVVNEPISNETCTQTLKCGLRSYFWPDKLGPEYMDLAFQFAREADPNAKLYLNETGLEANTPVAEERRKVLLRVLDDLQQRGVPVDGVGLQAHLAIAGDLVPLADLHPFFQEIARRKLDIAVTELDVKAPPSWGGGARPAAQRQAALFRQLLQTCLDEPRCGTFILWGFTDRVQWLHADAAPLDADYRPKPAWDALLDELRAHPVNPQRAAAASAPARGR